MNRIGDASTLILLAAAVLMGCGRGNGLPHDLTAHLAARGISISPARVHAPLSSRGGYVVVRHVPQTAASIVSQFALEKIQADDRRWAFALERAGGSVSVKELWGATGRPAQFKLRDGGQLEYFYLLITNDGWMYLIAEYAYG